MISGLSTLQKTKRTSISDDSHYALVLGATTEKEEGSWGAER